MTEIELTPLAERQFEALTGRHRKAMTEHLYGDDRAIVGFDTPDVALVIMIGPHATTSKLDVYANLWLACGLDEPPAGPRDKPSCCEGDGGPPFMVPDDLRELLARLRSITRSLT